MRPSSAHRSGLVAGMLVVGLVAGLFGPLEPARAAGSVIYVVSGGTGDGTSWANASDLQAALMAAVAPAELWVQTGTYTPTTDDEDQRKATFTLKTGVAIYGGFTGTETLLSERNAAVNVTTLSGDIGAAGSADNSYHVVTGSGTDATAILDGATITAGNADGIDTGILNFAGGGIFNNVGSPTLANLTISGNYATRGGGLYNMKSNPVLTNVTISGNTASGDGGGVVNYVGSNPVLTNVTISGNTATEGGGAMYNRASSPVLTNVTVSGNTAGRNGGLYNVNSRPVLTNVTISGNTAMRGGGVFNDAGSNVVVRNSIVWGNLGGAILDDTTSMSDVQYSLIEAGYFGTGNLNTDPRFVAAVPPAPSTGGNLRLQVGSPAINAGSNNALPPDLTTDRDGNPRIIATTVDMGAYEQQPVPPSNLLRNPGFELDANNDAKPDDWSVHPNVWRHAAAKRTGSYGMLHYTTADTTYAVYTGVPNLQAGTTYTFSGQVYALPAANDTFGFTLAVQWRNSSNGVLGTELVKSYIAATGGWNLAEKQILAPPGTSYALVVLVAQSLKGAVAVDDFVFRP